MSDEEQASVVHVNGDARGEAETTNAGTSSAFMRRHLSDSIYLWACGEKADKEDDDPELSDRLIGWLILFMQGFAYTMLIFLARSTSDSATGISVDESGQSGYLLPSVTGAMYLLVGSTSHDLRAGYFLLVNGEYAGHRAFGVGLLIVYGIMISAAMTVLVSTSSDNASVVLNAVTVLFVAEMDEKALKFLSGVSKQWRLFWAIESAGISFALAIVAIFYMGDSSSLLEGSNGILKEFPTWFVWVVNPAAVTLFSVVLSATLHALCELLSGICNTVSEPTFGALAASTFKVLTAAANRGNDRFMREPCFHVALVLWLAAAANNWFFMERNDNGFPIAVAFNPPIPPSENASMALTNNTLVLVYSNLALVIGLAARATIVCLRRCRRVRIEPCPRHSSQYTGSEERRDGYADSGVPSLLIGSGVGYWVSTLLYVLGCSWHGGGCGWNNAPVIVTAIAYVLVPPFVLAGFFMVADVNILGSRFGAFIKPAVGSLRNWHRIEYWIVAAVFRDFVDMWIGFCGYLGSPLLYFV